jgi:hypothetical protein
VTTGMTYQGMIDDMDAVAYWYSMYYQTVLMYISRLYYHDASSTKYVLSNCLLVSMMYYQTVSTSRLYFFLLLSLSPMGRILLLLFLYISSSRLDYVKHLLLLVPVAGEEMLVAGAETLFSSFLLSSDGCFPQFPPI